MMKTMKTMEPEIIKNISALNYTQIFRNSSKFEKEKADSSNKISNQTASTNDSIQNHKKS